MEEVKTLKAEREVIERTMRDPVGDIVSKFMASLRDLGDVDEEAISEAHLRSEYGRLQQQVCVLRGGVTVWAAVGTCVEGWGCCVGGSRYMCGGGVGLLCGWIARFCRKLVVHINIIGSLLVHAKPNAIMIMYKLCLLLLLLAFLK